MDMWFSLGVHFNVPPYQLFAWKKEHRDSPIECLTAMLQWLSENQQLTWVNVVQALFTIERRNLARDICSKFGTYISVYIYFKLDCIELLIIIMYTV